MLALFFQLFASLQPTWEPAFHETLKDGERGHITIADVGDALTFARADIDGTRRVLAVTSWKGGIVEAIDLSAGGAADPVALFRERGYDKLADQIRSAPESVRLRIASHELVVPIDCSDRHIAAGTNYPEHAADAGTTRPFLFPKVVQPGKSGDEVSVHGGLLDYEVEITVVPLEPLANADPAYLGVVVANDFTDRETLMHVVDRSDVESGKGFTTGKSFPGYLPVGGLFVIPRDWRTFVPSLELRLYVNGALRQRASASEMVWDVREVLSQVLARKGERWEHRGDEVALFEGDAIAERTLILTGTPHGTVFDGVPNGVIVRGVGRWLAGGWHKGVAASVVDVYADDARAAKAYLQPGDEVLIRVDRLGEISSRVVP